MPNETVVLALMIGLGILAAFTVGVGLVSIVDWVMQSLFQEVEK